ncbi:F-box/kelch-repeat protein At3g23880-like [Lycium ferocissimum]|uniref:F-box/kelch-repeat protein At3g23880-like n=1 Tax=Lycium ferocissimum TaxID=112874 RepID=UPI0028149C3F|nr:F-box/kelch-repeat protein At3g23880-like [Lycium ferocissimum]
MESKGDEASHQHPKQSKPTNHSPFPSTSIQESALTISILPQELITDILLKLPVKPLLKFRCVSKSWLALISSPQFVKTHLSICANDKDYTNHRVVLKVNSPEFNLKDCSLNSLLYDPVTEAFDLGYPMKNPRKPLRSIRIVGSVNGLICLVIGVNDFFLWNPSIRKFKKLPDPTDGFYIMYGFGYDEFHDDYKVVAICNNLRYNGSHHVEVKIYSLKSDSWTSTYECWSGGVLSTRWGTLVNGKLHWTTTTTTTRVGVNNPKDIICIDLADKKWGKVEQPCYGEGDFNCTLSLGVLGGDLALFYDYLRTHADVWVMKEYGVKESWTKMLTINYPNDPTAYLFLHTFCMSNKGEILFEFGSSFVVYNLNDNSIRNPEITNCNFIRQAIIYIESLVWPLLDKEPIIQQQ